MERNHNQTYVSSHRRYILELEILYFLLHIQFQIFCTDLYHCVLTSTREIPWTANDDLWRIYFDERRKIHPRSYWPHFHILLLVRQKFLVLNFSVHSRRHVFPALHPIRHYPFNKWMFIVQCTFHHVFKWTLTMHCARKHCLFRTKIDCRTVFVFPNCSPLLKLYYLISIGWDSKIKFTF